MKKITLLLVLFSLFLGTTQCTITKRSYRKGLHISWHKSKTSKEKTDLTEKSVEVEKSKVLEESRFSEEIIGEIERSEALTLDQIPEQNLTEKTIETQALLPEKKSAQPNKLQKLVAAQKALLLEEEPKEEEEEENTALRVVLIIIGVILYLFLSFPLFILGFLAAILISESGFLGYGGLSELAGLLVGFFIFWLGGFGLMMLLFRPRNKKKEVVRKSILVKAIVSLVLALLATAILALILFL